MKKQKEIKDWLEFGKSYNEGLILLSKYSKNRNLQRMLSRTKKPKKLEYELRKISKLQKFKPEPGSKSAGSTEPKGDDQQGSGLVQVLKKKSVRYEDLPENLQKVYDEIKVLYKERATYHTKAKLLTAQGADQNIIGNLVKKIKEADQQIRENWPKIDNYDPDAEKSEEPGNDNGPDDNVPITFKRISANRKYISSNKNKLQQDPEKWRPKIQQRVNELVRAGETFKPEIVEELKAYGIKL